MKTTRRIRGGDVRRFLILFVAGLCLASMPWAHAAGKAKRFNSPEDAVQALIVAVNDRNTNALSEIFGSEFTEIRSPDTVQNQNDLTAFADSVNTSNRLTRVDSVRCILETGEDHWPFAIPIVQQAGGWLFDTAAGKEELLNRRIGHNELLALKAVRAYAQAQREYASTDRDGDEVLEFAQKLMSSPGTKDGLYWSPEIDGEISPLGPALVAAQSEGYFQKPRKEEAPEPFHGYFFKILTKQGKHAPGGAYDYVINGHMIGGFACVVWPAQYGNSGVMTFIINQQGKVYQKNLGTATESAVKKMSSYDPDPSWKISTE